MTISTEDFYIIVNNEHVSNIVQLAYVYVCWRGKDDLLANHITQLGRTSSRPDGESTRAATISWTPSWKPEHWTRYETSCSTRPALIISWRSLDGGAWEHTKSNHFQKGEQRWDLVMRKPNQTRQCSSSMRDEMHEIYLVQIALSFSYPRIASERCLIWYLLHQMVSETAQREPL